MSLCLCSVVDVPVLCSGWLAASSDAVVASVPLWSVQYCSCASERKASRSKAPLADLRLSSHVCVFNEIGAALGSLLVTGTGVTPPEPRLWPCGMSTCLAGAASHSVISSQTCGKRDNQCHILEQVRSARRPDAGMRRLTDLPFGRLARSNRRLSEYFRRIHAIRLITGRLNGIHRVSC